MNLDKLVEDAWLEGTSRYTIIHNPNESNIDRVSGLMADDMLAKLASERETLKAAIYARWMKYFEAMNVYHDTD